MRQKELEKADDPATDAPTRRGFPIYDENPSIVGRFPVAIRARKMKGATTATMIAPDTGEVLAEGTFGFITEEEVDNEKFVKIYLDGIKQHGQLTKAGLTIFEFVYNQISGLQGKDRDTIMLNHYIAHKWKSDLSRATYYRGMNELLERGFLFRSPAADVYFINVRFLFNGDRMTVIKAYRRKGSTLQQELPLGPPKELEAPKNGA
jgi:hypothetical protein